MSTLDEMEMPTLTFDPAPVPEEKAPVVPVQEEKAELDDSMLNDKERQMVKASRNRSTFAIPTASCSMVREPRKRWLIFLRKHWKM